MLPSRSYRTQTDGVLAAALVLRTPATAAYHQPACSLLTSTRALPIGCLLRPRTSWPQKYDHQCEQEIRECIEEVTGHCISNNLMDSLKDGIILCKCISKLQARPHEEGQ